MNKLLNVDVFNMTKEIASEPKAQNLLVSHINIDIFVHCSTTIGVVITCYIFLLC